MRQVLLYHILPPFRNIVVDTPHTRQSVIRFLHHIRIARLVALAYDMSFILDMDIILELCSVRLSVPYNWPKLAKMQIGMQQPFSSKEKEKHKTFALQASLCSTLSGGGVWHVISYRVVLDLPHVVIQCTMDPYAPFECNLK